MKPRLSSLLLTVSVFTFWLISTTPARAQKNKESFAELHEYFTSLDQEGLMTKGDSLVKALFIVNNASLGRYDSLVSGAILTHYQAIKTKTILTDQLPILQLKQEMMDELATAPIEDRTKLVNQFIIHFRQSTQIDSLALYLRKMRDLLDQLVEPTELEINLAYENARYAYLQNDFLASLTFLQNGLRYLEEYYPERVRMKINLLNGIGVGYRRTNQPQLAIQHHHHTLSYLADQDPGSSWEGIVLNNLGLCHSDLGQKDDAIFYMKKAISAYQRLGNEYRNEIATGFDNIAIAFRDLGQPDSALHYSRHSLKLMRQYFGTNYPDQLLPLSTLTETYYLDDQLVRADSMSRLGISFLEELGWSVHDPHGDYYLTDAINLLATSLQIKHARYEKSGQMIWIRDAVSMGAAYMATIDYAYDGIFNSQSRDIFHEKSRHIFSLAVQDLYRLFQLTGEDSLLDMAFNYIEKYKSIELLQAAQKDKIQVDPTFQRLNEEQALLMDSVYLLEKSVASSDEPADHTRLNLAMEKLYQWQQAVKANQPRYYNLIHHPEPLSIQAVQDRILTEDKTILSYHLADDIIFLMVINQSQTRFEMIPVSGLVSKMIEDLRDNVFSYFLSDQKSEQLYTLKTENFIEASLALYDILVRPVRQFLKKRVLIIPDKSLGYLPFDILLADRPSNMFQFKTHDYLIQHHTFSYCYSVYLAIEMQEKPHADNIRLLAVAPSFISTESKGNNLYAVRSSLDPLNFNLSESESVLSQFRGLSLQGVHATKSQFLGQSNSFGIIHLATHGKANDAEGDLSYLAFSNWQDPDFKLYANEIYCMDLQSELVTLSACESGLGELQSSEGIISLARAFSFAGAKSIVSTLWSVDDQSTVDLMSAFYRNLSRSEPKDIALQQAKISYIKRSDHAGAHPFFWSGFVAVGDMNPIPKKSGAWIFYLLTILGLVGLIALILRLNGILIKFIGH